MLICPASIGSNPTAKIIIASMHISEAIAEELFREAENEWHAEDLTSPTMPSMIADPDIQEEDALTIIPNFWFAHSAPVGYVIIYINIHDWQRLWFQARRPEQTIRITI